jgi:DNA-binding response OmpR family regulator
MSKPRILIIDDDLRLSTMLEQYLQGRGFETVARADARSGMARLSAGGVDGLILDVMLPDRSGLDLCRELRGSPQGAGLPIVMLTAVGEAQDRIVGLELGADDYLPKPFEPRELVARLDAVMRRRAPRSATAPKLSFDRLEIHSDTRRVYLDGEERPLTFHQFELLWKLASNPGRVYSRGQLMEVFGDRDRPALERSIDVHVSRVRGAIEDDPKKPSRLLTVRGVGYTFAKGPT